MFHFSMLLNTFLKSLKASLNKFRDGKKKKWFGLEMIRDIFNYITLLRVPFNLILNKNEDQNLLQNLRGFETKQLSSINETLSV